MGKLNILYHKSYHVYNRENVERVKRDELRAELEEDSKTQSRIAANSEARLTLLRHQKDQLQHESSRKKERRIERALEDQLKGKRPERQNEEAKDDGPSEPRHKSRTDNSSIVDPKNGHINFWSGLEHQSSSKVFGSTAGLEPNQSYMNDQKKKDDKWEELITMRLDRPAHELRPWYAESDLKNGQDKKLSERKVSERAAKDEDLKRHHDPLRLVKSSIYRSNSSTASSYPRKRLERKASRSPSPVPQTGDDHSDDDQGDQAYMPTLPPPASTHTSSPLTKPEVLRVDRSAERLRAQALLDRHRKSLAPRLSETTPTTGRGYSDVYNRTEVDAVKRESESRRQRRTTEAQEPVPPKRARYWE